MKESMLIYAERQILKRKIGVTIMIPRIDGKIDVAQPLVFKAQDQETTVLNHTFEISPNEAQQMIDELWNCGVRPTEGGGSAGSIAATEKHLKDMKSIAFGALKNIGVKLDE